VDINASTLESPAASYQPPVPSHQSPARWTKVPTPLGDLTVVGDGERIVGLYMEEQRHRPPADRFGGRDDRLLAGAVAQIEEYFAGERRAFDLDVGFPAATDFQRTVWTELAAIPYGETISYGTFAERIGRPAAARAVGLANGRNPVAIVVPCHRVIGGDGSLTGYGGGIERKRWLLDFEAAHAR
jgi:methylated-DNA-[protein]-cysteine S-methyltransferase